MEAMRESWTDDRLDYLKRRVEDGFRLVDERFKLVDKRFEQIDKRFEQVDKRLDRIESGLHAIGTELHATHHLLAQLGAGLLTVVILGFLGVIAALV